MEFLRRIRHQRSLPFLMGAALYGLSAASVLQSIPMIFGLHFTFAGVFIMIALRLYGILPAVFLSVVTLVTGMFFVGFAPAFLFTVIEVMFVGWMMRRRTEHLLIADLIYWITVGWLITGGAYYADTGRMGVDLLLLLFKSVVNGTFNALIADIAMAYLPLRRMAGQRLPEAESGISLQQILFHIVMVALMVPFVLFMIIVSWYQNNSMVERAGVLTEGLAAQLNQELRTWGEEELRGLRLHSLVELSRLNEVLVQMGDKAGVRSYVLDTRDAVVASNVAGRIQKPWEWPAGWQMYPMEAEGLYLGKPAPGSRLYEMAAWEESSFYYSKTLNGLPYLLLLEVPMHVFLEELQPVHTLNYSLVLLFIFLAVMATLLISRRLTRVLHLLGQATADLPQKLREEGEIHWPETRVTEVHRLTTNFRAMSGELLKMFLETVRMNSRLQSQTMQLRESERRLEQLAYYDMLTGLPNRLHFSKYLSEWMEQPAEPGLSAAVLFLDLDRFKQINDTFGHSAGDELIIDVAKKLSGGVRYAPVFRLGGDEFVVLASHRRREEVVETAEAILAALSEPVILQGQEIFVRSSIGISIFPGDAQDAEALLKNADDAMYEAKERGGGQYAFYSEATSESAAERLQLEQALHRALAAGEFELFYQPQYGGTDGRINGMEALIRWKHPAEGYIPPVRFIPLAEQTGEIRSIGEWVLREACLQGKRLQEHAPGLLTAVNLSPRQLDQPDLVERVRAILQETGMPAGLLELEITEEFFIRNQDKAEAALQQFKEMGIRLAIDDFGTGYSSFAQMKRIMPDTLKIDRSFIRGLDQDESNASIVQALITMAHSLKLKVVGEGVETEEELLSMRRFGCDEIQGYYYSKPLPLAELEALLKGAPSAASSDEDREERRGDS
ncbi:putative bifunctional diguanylate cyclase/phosphodiesterase [Paenibacillus mucilaginosus]|uniref:Diguanylate cyclase/phosphodiesterase n=1 Tax=Paenibacillus mucilaginosus (strain KNP414) TaxID=1036673 RepID=F8FP01_PAEMK|nr:EAL domain-containing protein [Paenibacillus mucilaginosus]AEI45780.1 diguanylate cyclase/phosphodiesterase [Paenibacillus mucilaginosus KNP414]MCG7215035.1 EAL domain-containing protein [Paenibacillus mucilaginosus]WDM27156.1 EAL domain-containing protein [Paenibacillus mucilaginosus]